MKKIILFLHILFNKSKTSLPYAFYTLLTLCTMHYALCPSFSWAAVRYVSHSGSNTPPYLTWETAADSIMSAINISSFGDTIYVANGVYEEQVVMIPGLSLIGAGQDSCIIDTRTLVNAQEFISVEVKDSCLLKGFEILVFNNSNMGWGVKALGSSKSLITLNKITNAHVGVLLDGSSNESDVTVYNNICANVTTGIYLFNSNSLVRGNIIYTDLTFRGINIGAYTYNFTPHIDSNYIVAGQTGIAMVFDTKATFSNNIIILKGQATYGIFGGNPDTSWTYNNLIIAESALDGIGNILAPVVNYNNLVVGNYDEAGIFTYNYNVILNNNVINGNRGIYVPSGNNPIIKYNNSWNNNVNYRGFTPDSTNLSVNPMLVNDDSTQGELDFHLQAYSPLIDRGDPDILDKDNSRSDIGLYGGPYGESYKYLDLPPRFPVNFTAVLETNDILLSWNKNTEADFNHYNLYRDTTEGFTIDSTTLVASIEDTFYLHIIPPGVNNLYFKLTALDNQGNQSEASEEEHIVLSGTINNEHLTINNYRLYQNYPNPFNPSTKIGYRLKERGYVKLYVYDIKGELVKVLVNKYQDKGYYEVEFSPEIGGQPAGGEVSPNGGRSEVNSLASGVYIYQIMVRNDKNIPVYSDVKKMIFLK